MPTGPQILETSRAGEAAVRLRHQALNAPNIITLSRLVLSIVLFVLIDIGGWWRTAAAVFTVAACTDFVDGYIARKYGLVTVLGRILDPFVDKIIICGAFIFLQKWPASGVTAWITFLILAREMFITSLRTFLEQRGQDFSAKWSGKLKMILQCIAVPACLLSLSPEFNAWLTPWLSESAFLVLRDACLWLAVAITVYSGLEYTLRAARMLSMPPPEDAAT
ncbi:MAG: CDP-diacylglycerol--glycerol-3-phosphate 3-phosphatidyltransferase [Planctomycetaceae bacterium]|nr:CDP-diacylglycerol--glycerol-3-phosphate 3-phosphatidyltransferase [Planctomycetaceae bacterium]